MSAAPTPRDALTALVQLLQEAVIALQATADRAERLLARQRAPERWGEVTRDEPRAAAPQHARRSRS